MEFLANVVTADVLFEQLNSGLNVVSTGVLHIISLYTFTTVASVTTILSIFWFVRCLEFTNFFCLSNHDFGWSRRAGVKETIDRLKRNLWMNYRNRSLIALAISMEAVLLMHTRQWIYP